VNPILLYTTFIDGEYSLLIDGKVFPFPEEDPEGALLFALKVMLPPNHVEGRTTGVWVCCYVDMEDGKPNWSSIRPSK